MLPTRAYARPLRHHDVLPCGTSVLRRDQFGHFIRIVEAPRCSDAAKTGEAFTYVIHKTWFTDLPVGNDIDADLDLSASHFIYGLGDERFNAASSIFFP